MREPTFAGWMTCLNPIARDYLKRFAVQLSQLQSRKQARARMKAKCLLKPFPLQGTDGAAGGYSANCSSFYFILYSKFCGLLSFLDVALSWRTCDLRSILAAQDIRGYRSVPRTADHDSWYILSWQVVCRFQALSWHFATLTSGWFYFSPVGCYSSRARCQECSRISQEP